MIPAVSIKITKESTGETVYSQEYMSPAEASIDLNIKIQVHTTSKLFRIRFL